jgi:hypothetical protein
MKTNQVSTKHTFKVSSRHGGNAACGRWKRNEEEKTGFNIRLLFSLTVGTNNNW